MIRSARLPRVVIDTNLVLSALVLAQGRLGALRHAWQGTHCQPLLSSATAAELLTVLESQNSNSQPQISKSC